MHNTKPIHQIPVPVIFIRAFNHRPIGRAGKIYEPRPEPQVVPLDAADAAVRYRAARWPTQEERAIFGPFPLTMNFEAAHA